MGVSRFTSGNSQPPGGGGGNGPLMTPMGPLQGTMSPADLLIDLGQVNHSPVLFRDGILTQLQSILIGKHKPNALLIGPAGTGKTAIAEELAARIKVKDPALPPSLLTKTIYSLQVSDLISGSSLLGQLEQKVNEIVDFLQDPKNEAIVFIDEIHQLMSGKNAYQTIAQILKPALSRGKLRVIGATTTQEAKELDTDPAFNRRFTRVLVDELSKAQTVEILMASVPGLVQHYKQTFSFDNDTANLVVSIADEFCSAGSHRPDNAITLLDRCIANGVMDKQSMLASPDPAIQAAAKALTGIVLSENSIRQTALKLATGNNEPTPFDEGRFRKDFERIYGQDAVLEPLLRLMKRHTAHLRPQTKPLTILFMGASGTGKTEVTKILAQNYLTEKPIILNMTEYASPASIARIIGAPAGYVGYDQNDELPFDALDTNPYQVILLDEFEKCHKSVQTLFMRVFDEGVLKTSRGKVIDFTKSIIIATTNAGCTNDAHQAVGFACGPETALSDKQLIQTLQSYFSLELLNRFQKRYRFADIDEETFQKILKDVYAREVREIKAMRPRAPLPDALSDADALALSRKYYNKAFGARPAAEAVSEHIDEIMVP